MMRVLWPAELAVSRQIKANAAYTAGNSNVDEMRLLSQLFNFEQMRTQCARVQELCDSRGGRPGLSVLTSLTVFVDVKQH